MDAVKFIKERDRMFEVAKQAPSLCYGHKKSAEEIVREVEEWSATHPVKTRQSVFLSHYPNAEVDEDGVLKVCPKVVEGSSYMYLKCGGVPCAVCHKAYWSVVVKEGNANNV